MKFSKEIIVIKNLPEIVDQVVTELKTGVTQTLRRKGAVVGISGGIDSSVSLALSVKAFGADKVLGIMLPEKDSNPESALLAQKLADKFGVKTLTENITGALDGFGCYSRRDEAVKKVFPEYDPLTYKMKIGVKQNNLNQNLPPLFYLTIVDSQGLEYVKMLPPTEYLQIVASSNFKQRCRMSMLYYHAERLHYAVIGTPNKHEVEQGFFVKHGDGGADIMPIGKFYKTQVFQLAKHLGVPQEIIDRTPTTDTYTAEQTQEEFFYQMPFQQMDLLWFAFENKFPKEEVAAEMKMTVEDLEKIYSNFNRKQITTDYLRRAAIHIK